MDVNTIQVSSGQGFIQLDIFSCLLNMPNISNKLYQKPHERVLNFTNITAWELMSSVVEEAN